MNKKKDDDGVVIKYDGGVFQFADIAKAESFCKELRIFEKNMKELGANKKKKSDDELTIMNFTTVMLDHYEQMKTQFKSLPRRVEVWARFHYGLQHKNPTPMVSKPRKP